MEAFGLNMYTGTLGVFCSLSALVAWKHHATNRARVGAEPVPAEFRAFQRNYLVVYLLCAYSDWLKGPYVYALYESYGFDTQQIALLFVGGFLSSLVFGTFFGSLSDRVGRKYMCLVFCGVYAGSALTKIINDFWVLLFGRVLSGIATSLLTTSFESWMVSEHQSRGFSAALLTNTFSKVTLGNGVVAIAAGFSAQIAASCCGYAAPFLLAVPCLAGASFLIASWTENFGNQAASPLETLTRGWASIEAEPKRCYLGLCQSLFEGCIYVWVFYWTPSIATEETKSLVPYGLVFATYMAALMIGGAIPDLLPVESVAFPLHCVAALTCAVSAAFFDNKFVVLLAFVLYEGSVGVYFPTAGTLRSVHLDESTRSAVMNIFRVPLNMFVVAMLQIPWHPRYALAAVALTQALSLVFYKMFNDVVSNKAPLATD